MAAAFVNGRVPGVQVTAHVGKLQDHEPEWYKEYNLVIAVRTPGGFVLRQCGVEEDARVGQAIL